MSTSAASAAPTALVGDASPYSVTISMSQSSANELTDGGFSLYGFKSVTGPGKGGRPLVWFKTSVFSTSTVVSWNATYFAYTSQTDISSAAEIRASNTTGIRLGQIWAITDGNGTGEDPVNGGQANAITVVNKTQTPMTCGISAPPPNDPKASPVPLCAFPLHGNNTDPFLPIEKVVFMFATDEINTGTVVEQAFGPAVVIDVTDQNAVAVNYDIDTGWSGGGFPTLDSGVSLLPALTER